MSNQLVTATRFQRLRVKLAGRGRAPAHFLHIRKTAGTAMRHVLTTTPARAYRVVVRGHGATLHDVPRGEAFFFIVRDPVARYVSGFNSRLRQGQPRYHYPWSEAEAAAFERFQTPGDLARALSSTEDDTRAAAETAMQTIEHVSSSYWDWFIDEDTLRGRAGDILFIGFQEQLDQDFATLATILGLPPSARLPDDGVLAHRSPSHLARDVDAEGERNLQRWYRSDFEFVALCRELRNEIDRR